MYRAGQEVLARGLGRGASLVLGFVAALMCAAAIVMAPSSGSPVSFYLFALFCAAIAIACLFTGAIRRSAGRFLGAAVFLVSGWYLFSQLLGGVLVSGSHSQPSALNAAILMAVAGVPGLLFALFGRFTWRQDQETRGEP